jgi:hypothetical protein
MPKLQAAVPPGAPPNALLRVRLPDGNEVNVRVPKGLKPGDEFIFEVNTSGGVVGTSGTGTSTIAEGFPKLGGGSGAGGGTGKKSDKSHSNNKPVSKNPKKKAKGTHADGSHHHSGGGAAVSSVGGRGGDSSNHHHAGGGGGAPSFVTRFFNIYNQVYDILSQVNEGSNSLSSSPLTQLQRKSSNSSNSSSNQPSTTSQQPPSSDTQTQFDSDMLDDALASEITTISSSRRLLDKEITSYEGLMTSLAASTFIGFSILVGFLGGVLYATPPDDVVHRRW